MIGPHEFKPAGETSAMSVTCAVCWRAPGDPLHAKPVSLPRPPLGRIEEMERLREKAILATSFGPSEQPDTFFASARPPAEASTPITITGIPIAARPTAVYVNGIRFVPEPPAPAIADCGCSRAKIALGLCDLNPPASKAPPVTASDYHAACASCEQSDRVVEQVRQLYREEAAHGRRQADEIERLRTIAAKLQEETLLLIGKSPMSRHEECRARAEELGTDREKLSKRVGQLLDAITKHWKQKADDRCWMDDSELYAAAGLPANDRSVGNKFEMIKSCARFIELRCYGGDRPTYASLEARIEHVKRVLGSLYISLSAMSAEQTPVRDGLRCETERVRNLRADLDRWEPTETLPRGKGGE